MTSKTNGQAADSGDDSFEYEDDVTFNFGAPPRNAQGGGRRLRLRTPLAPGDRGDLRQAGIRGGGGGAVGAAPARRRIHERRSSRRYRAAWTCGTDPFAEISEGLADLVDDDRPERCEQRDEHRRHDRHRSGQRGALEQVSPFEPACRGSHPRPDRNGRPHTGSARRSPPYARSGRRSAAPGRAACRASRPCWRG